VSFVAVYKVERARALPDAEARTLFFSIKLGGRKRGYRFFEPGEVPAFEGDHAWFEIERARGQWRFIRQVEAPSGG
jgi:hypothetical protein